MSYLVSVIKRRSYTYIKEKCWPSLNLNVKLKSLHVLNLEVSVRSDEKVLWEWVFPGTIFLRTLTATHLSAVTTPRLSSLENRQALPANSLCQVFCAHSFMSIVISHISFCISLFSLVIFEHLSRSVLHCRLLRMLDKCSSARFQRKQPQYSLTHSDKWTKKINCIIHNKF